MNTKPLLIAANWKMNPLTLKEAERIIRSLELGINGLRKKDFNEKIELVLCPPAIYLNGLGGGKFWHYGAQNVHGEARGAYTGETAMRMVEDAGCKYVILGHSERRKYFGETDDSVNLKLQSCLKTTLKPIICVGETKEQRDKNQTTKVIVQQLKTIFKNVSVQNLARITIAYEPIWAISTMGNGAATEADDPNDVMGIIILIRKALMEMYRSNMTEKVRIIYGGSVDLRNIDQFLDVDIIEGFLIGGASLSMFDFMPILRKAYVSRTK